jgi:hypothetical protein
MQELKRLATTVKEAARIREASWDDVKEIGYKKTLAQSVSEACQLCSNDWYNSPVFTMLYFNWDNSLHWATKVLGG